MIKAVIFDLDGTIIDTEKYYRKFWPLAAKDFGYVITDEQALYLRSLGRPFAPAKFKEWFGEDFDYKAVKAHRMELMEAEIAREGIKAKKGAREIIDYLKSKNILTAIATASDMDRAERYLSAVDLWGCFDKVITATMVKQGKPSPDIYQYACEQLNLLPSECIAVEDSPNGVTSAYMAGLKVVLVPDQTEPEEEIIPYTYAIVEDLTKIATVVEKLD